MFSLIIVLATLTIVQIILVQREIVSQKREEYFVKNRIRDMNDFYDNIVRDSEKSLNIIAKRAISISTSHVVQEGVPLTDADEVIKELMVDGTFNGTEEFLMEDSKISDWSQKMTDLAELKGYYLSLLFENLEVKPYDSFNLVVDTDLRVNITDKNGVASLNRTTHITTLVSIEGFEDPVYPLNTNGMVTNKIYQTPFSGNFTQLLATGSGDNGWKRGLTFSVEGDVTPAVNCPNKSTRILVIDDPTLLSVSVVNQYGGVVSRQDVLNTTTIPYVSGVSDVTHLIPNTTFVLVDGDNNKVWYIENFVSHVGNGYYEEGEGPSFLDRLEGKLYIQSKYSSKTSNNIGLESFVNKTDLLAHKLSINTGKTNVDYMYFSNASYPESQVKGVDSYFRIDSDHAGAYGVNEILVD